MVCSQINRMRAKSIQTGRLYSGDTTSLRCKEQHGGSHGAGNVTIVFLTDSGRMCVVELTVRQ